MQKSYCLKILLVGIIFVSCKSDSNQDSLNQFEPEIIKISQASMNNHALIVPSITILNHYKKTPLELENCYQVPIRHKQGIISFDCWYFNNQKDMTFHVKDDTAYLHSLSFVDNESEITLPNLKLSSHTTLNELKDIFPNSITNKNIGVNEASKLGYEWIYLVDDLPSDNKVYKNRVELWFNDGRLCQFKYWVEPDYSKEQLEKFQTERDLYFNENSKK